jgi:hypothetical protein
MTDHARAQELAASAIDFDLPAEDRVELEAHLAGCPACRDHAEGLRRDARSLTGLPRFDAPERVRRRVGSEPRPRQVFRPTWAALTASALVVVIGVAVATGGLSFGPDSGGPAESPLVAQASPRASGTSSGAASHVPSTSAASHAPATPTPRVPGTDWLAVARQPAFDPKALTPDEDTSPPLTCDDCGDTSILSRRSAIRAIVETPDGFVAAGGGCIGGGRVTCQADVWRSSDGLTWEAVRNDGTLDAGANASVNRPSGMMDVAIGPQGIVAGGSVTDAAGRRAAVWSSPDGQSWHPIAIDHDGSGQITAVAAGASTLVAVGTVRTDAGVAAAAWVSPDGTTWEPAADLEGAAVGRFDGDDQGTAGPFDVLWFDGRFVAVGADCSSIDACRVAAWSSSPDGRSWTRITNIGAPGRLRSVADVGGRLVGVGDDGTWEGSAGRTWTSEDGTSWVPSNIGGEDAANGPLHAVVAVGPGAIAAGEGYALRSADVSSWTRSEDDDLANGTIYALATGPQGIIAVGQQRGDFVGEILESPPAAWILPYR